MKKLPALLLVLLAAFQLHAQAPKKFDASLLTGTWKCTTERYDSAGTRVVHHISRYYRYSFSSKGAYSWVLYCPDCYAAKNDTVTASGSWKMNSKGDSIFFEVPAQHSWWSCKIISLDAKQLAIAVPDEREHSVLVMEKITTPAKSSHTTIVPSASEAPAAKIEKAH